MSTQETELSTDLALAGPVKISVKVDEQGRCEIDPKDAYMPNRPNVQIRWSLNQPKPPQWQFNNITIVSAGKEFEDLKWDASSASVMDKNDNNVKYQYTVELLNSASGRKTLCDPSIINRSDGRTDRSARG